MKSSKRVFVNTIIQYTRTILSVIITLYTSRVILENLGVNDYGIYSLVGGVVTMLSFINHSLSTTTQRYLSFNHGKGDKQLLVKIFNNSVVTQTIISTILCGTLLALANPIFDNFLNIALERLSSAKIVYILTVITLFFNLQSTPYLATLIARENILYSSIIHIIDTIFKIPIAISLYYITLDKLIWYSICCSLLIVFNFVCYFIYCKKNYEECRQFSFSSFDLSLFKDMFSFMGWMIYSTGCVTGRTQGIAILLNKFFNTAINAAYGIGLQVSSQMSFLSSALITAIRPQIIKAEGAGNRKRAIRLSEMACKFSFFMMSLVSIPAIFHMNDLLSIWLVKVPEHAVMFCQYILLAVCIDQLTSPLAVANAAVGNVRIYSLWVNTIKLLTLPFVYLILKLKYPVESVMIIYLVFETICMISRLVFLRINIQLNILEFLKNVIIPLIIPLTISIICCNFTCQHFENIWVLINFGITFLIYGSSFLLLGLKNDEKEILKSILKRK